MIYKIKSCLHLEMSFFYENDFPFASPIRDSIREVSVDTRNTFAPLEDLNENNVRESDLDEPTTNTSSESSIDVSIESYESGDESKEPNVEGNNAPTLTNLISQSETTPFAQI